MPNPLYPICEVPEPDAIMMSEAPEEEEISSDIEITDTFEDTFEIADADPFQNDGLPTSSNAAIGMSALALATRYAKLQADRKTWRRGEQGVNPIAIAHGYRELAEEIRGGKVSVPFTYPELLEKAFALYHELDAVHDGIVVRQGYMEVSPGKAGDVRSALSVNLWETAGQLARYYEGRRMTRELLNLLDKLDPKGIFAGDWYGPLLWRLVIRVEEGGDSEWNALATLVQEEREPNSMTVVQILGSTEQFLLERLQALPAESLPEERAFLDLEPIITDLFGKDQWDELLHNSEGPRHAAELRRRVREQVILAVDQGFLERHDSELMRFVELERGIRQMREAGQSFSALDESILWLAARNVQGAAPVDFAGFVGYVERHISMRNEGLTDAYGYRALCESYRRRTEVLRR